MRRRPGRAFAKVCSRIPCKGALLPFSDELLPPTLPNGNRYPCASARSTVTRVRGSGGRQRNGRWPRLAVGWPSSVARVSKEEGERNGRGTAAIGSGEGGPAPLEEVGALPERAPVGNGARGLFARW